MKTILAKFSKILDLIEQRLVPNELVEVSIDKGQRYFINPGFSAQGYKLFLTNKYGAGSELEFQKLFSYIVRDGYIVVDVGAHFGFYTLIAAERVGSSGRVLAFEPSSFNYRILLLNIKNNRYKNIIPFNFALGDKNTKCKIGLLNNAKSGENTMAITDDAKYVEEVSLKRFDTVLKDSKILQQVKALDVVKIDVEGAEVLVLKGFGKLLNRVKYILCEIHPNQIKLLGTDLKEFFKMLKTKGFRIFIIKGLNVEELKNPDEIKERVHTIAINTYFLDAEHELRRFSNILQQPYTLVKKDCFPYKIKLYRCGAELIHHIKVSLFKLYSLFYQQEV